MSLPLMELPVIIVEFGIYNPGHQVNNDGACRACYSCLLDKEENKAALFTW